MNIVQKDFVYRAPLTPLILNNIKYIVIHHPEAIIASPEDIHNWHLEKGWSGFGYNEYIRKDGTVFIGRGDNVGAHAYRYNSISYGICCEGNYDTERNMPMAQFTSMVERIKFHKERFQNLQRIVGHGELNSTSCPGKFFPLQKALEEVEKQTGKSHWAKPDNDELLSAGILKEDHTKMLDNPATEGLVISLVNRIRKG